MEGTSPTENKQLTRGQIYIGVTFNVGGRQDVDSIKQAAAKMVDELWDAYDKANEEVDKDYRAWREENRKQQDALPQAGDKVKSAMPPPELQKRIDDVNRIWEDLQYAKPQIKTASMWAVGAVTRYREVK